MAMINDKQPLCLHTITATNVYPCPVRPSKSLSRRSLCLFAYRDGSQMEIILVHDGFTKIHNNGWKEQQSSIVILAIWTLDCVYYIILQAESILFTLLQHIFPSSPSRPRNVPPPVCALSVRASFILTFFYEFGNSCRGIRTHNAEVLGKLQVYILPFIPWLYHHTGKKLFSYILCYSMLPLIRFFLLLLCVFFLSLSVVPWSFSADLTFAQPLVRALVRNGS